MSTDKRPLVKNSGDPVQVAFGKRREQSVAKRRHALIAKQMSSYEGRAFVWSELERHHIFESIVADAPRIFVLAGEHNKGLELYQEIVVFPALYLEMQREAIARADRDTSEIEAAHTKRSDEADGEEPVT